MRDFPENPSALGKLSDIWHRLAYVARQDGRLEAAVRHAEAAVAAADGLSDGRQGCTTGLWRRYKARTNLADCLAACGQKAKARKILSETEPLQQLLIDAQKTAEDADDQRQDYLSHAVLAHMSDETQEAFDELSRTSLQLARAQRDRNVSVRAGVNLLGALSNRVFLFLHKGMPDEALSLAQEAAEVTRAVNAEISDKDIADGLTAGAGNILAAAHLLAGDTAAARPLLERALAYYQTKLADKREQDDLHICASVILKQGDAERLDGNLDAAQERYTSALALLDEVAKLAPDLASTSWDRLECLYRRAQAGGGEADMTAAKALWQELTAAGYEPPIDVWVRAFRTEHGV